MLFKAKGVLKYEIGNSGYKLIVDRVDPGISLFYRSLIPKWFRTQPQKYPPHISVVRKETPKNLKAWGKYEGQVIEFFYDPYIWNGTQYWWLNCFSKELEDIRTELGLENKIWDIDPEPGYSKCFHMSIANSKIVS